MQRSLFVLLLFVGCMTIIACGPSPDPEETLTPYESPNYRVTLAYPSDWTLDDNEDSISIASQAELINAASVENGAGLNITITPAGVMSTTDLIELIKTTVRSFREQENAEVIQEPVSSPINNQLAATTVIRGQDQSGNNVILQYTIILSQTSDQIAFITALNDADQADTYRPIIEAIINSIKLMPPG